MSVALGSLGMSLSPNRARASEGASSPTKLAAESLPAVLISISDPYSCLTSRLETTHLLVSYSYVLLIQSLGSEGVLYNNWGDLTGTIHPARLDTNKPRHLATTTGTPGPDRCQNDGRREFKKLTGA